MISITIIKKKDKKIPEVICKTIHKPNKEPKLQSKDKLMGVK